MHLIVNEVSTLLQTLFVGQEWKALQDVRVKATVVQSKSGEFVFSWMSSGRQYQSVNLSIDLSDGLAYDQVTSFIELSMHGCGCGPVRYQEVHVATILNAVWHLDTIYYSTRPIKQFSHKSGKKKAASHKLPHELGRLFLLFHCIAKKMVGGTKMIPQRSVRSHTMSDAVAEIFQFSMRPDATQVRQFWASVMNVVFPEGDTSLLSSTKETAMLSSHSASTHQASYSTTIVGGEEMNFRKYHGAIGSINAMALMEVSLSSSELLRGLQCLHGRDAKYISDGQRQMVETASVGGGRHVFVGLQCGGGKSMAWLVPLSASKLAGKKRKMHVVIVPYKFLAEFHKKSADTFFAEKMTVNTVVLSHSQIMMSTLPACLCTDTELPDLLIMGMDAATTFLAQHEASVRSWASDGILRGFYIDEIHTIYLEGFREAYEGLQRLAMFGVPVMTMSGTLRDEMVEDVMTYLGLSNRGLHRDFDRIADDSILGSYPEEFQIVVQNVHNLVIAASRLIESIFFDDQSFSVHVIVSSKQMAEELNAVLSVSFKTSVITSDKSQMEQEVVADLWARGDVDVLISTTAALVGNESSRCRVVVVAGFLFNLMSYVQAFGRLRPQQRKNNGSIHLIFPTISDEWKVRQQNDDEVMCHMLRSRCLISNSEEAFKSIGTSASVHDWLADDGCRVVGLSSRFGRLVNSCGVCDNCRNNNVSSLANTARIADKKSNDNKNLALNLLRRLETEFCLVCNSKQCNGEGCIGKGCCYVCGGGHYKSQCRVDVGVSVGQGPGACYYCLDMRSREDYKHHVVTACPTKRRIKHLLIEGWRKHGQSPSFGKFIASIYCSTNSFYDFLCHFGKDGMYHMGGQE